MEDYVSSYSAKLPAVSDRFIYPEYSLCNSVRGIFKLSGRGSSAAQRQLGPDGSAGEKYLFSEPWLCIAPSVAIMIVVLAFNFLGDGLRDVLDPYLKEQ